MASNDDFLKFEYNISEIFYSIQGEGTHSGLPCIFIRFQGCSLRCSWCDTKYALKSDKIEKILKVEKILEEISSYDSKLVCITGGEPLEQENIHKFLKLLCDANYQVLLETGGHINIHDIDERVSIILDMKAPASNMTDKNLYSNLENLKSNNELKIIIQNREDYLWAKDLIKKYDINNKIRAIHLSPAFGLIEPIRLAEWILEDNLHVRLQLQIHKYIWEPNTRGV